MHMGFGTRLRSFARRRRPSLPFSTVQFPTRYPTQASVVFLSRSFYFGMLVHTRSRLASLVSSISVVLPTITLLKAPSSMYFTSLVRFMSASPICVEVCRLLVWSSAEKSGLGRLCYRDSSSPNCPSG